VSLVYADSSALIKLVIRERESAVLKRWLTGKRVVSSRIAEVEVSRGARRSGREPRPSVEELLGEIDLIELDDRVVSRAVRLDPPELRSLDAIHLATALSIADDLDGFVTYDRQLGRAASAAGLPVATPR